jgi:uncharacterized ferredoxin-like protein
VIASVEQLREETARRQVQALMNRMLTAPKARGLDDLRILYVDGAEKDALTAWLRQHGEEAGKPGLVRDAGNVARGRSTWTSTAACAAPGPARWPGQTT